MDKPDIEILPNERWMNCPGYEDFYLVSDQGRIWSKPRAVAKVFKSGLFISNRKSKLFKLGSTLGGYSQAYLTNTKGVHVKELVHRLVAKAFLPNPNNGEYLVQHKDDDPTNNVYSNLSWGTHKSNFDDMKHKGRQVVAVGESIGNSKLKESEIREIRRLYETENFTKAELARMFKVSQPTVRSIVWYKTWKHITINN